MSPGVGELREAVAEDNRWTVTGLVDRQPDHRIVWPVGIMGSGQGMGDCRREGRHGPHRSFARSIRDMPTGLLPNPAPSDAIVTDPQSVAEAFMHALAAPDIDQALSLIADDIVYSNVGLPTVRGRTEVGKVLRALDRPSASFEVYLHSTSADGPVVLTERTDVIVLGPLRTQFWVWGRFDVHDGLITLWRDSFDFLDIARATVRALAGVAVPALRPEPPGPDDSPGR